MEERCDFRSRRKVRRRIVGSSEVIGELRAYVEKTQAQLGNCPTALIVSRGDEVLVEAYDSGAYTSLYDVDEASLWPLFSATKTYVAALLLNLCYEDVLAWDDPVVKHLPAFGSQGKSKIDPERATIRHLASHTSGIDLPPPESNRVPADLESGWIETEPGEVFNYSWQGM
ncbi:MAG: beta-lactamase family protein, partial [Candidatus Krumholzibacteriota bacterium]|nr:beta-lactamase family protein [Candidatus Krumholzibacteriota bacterium]